MKFGRKTIATLAGLELLAGAVLADGSTPGKVEMRTYLPQTKLVAGQTYNMEIRADTTGVPTEKFNNFQWRVNSNPNINPLGATYPSTNNPPENPGDIFYGFDLDTGWIPPAEWNVPQTRITYDANDGPSNREGLLATYTFRVPEGTPIGTPISVNFNSAYAYAVSGNVYAVSNENLNRVFDTATVVSGGVGDLNCDGLVNNGDIDPFVLALTDPVAYNIAYPGCTAYAGDMNSDGLVNNGDIDPFVARLTGG